MAEVAGELARAEVKSRRTYKSARSFKDFMYRTRRSWSCRRRVIGKAEFTEDEVLAVCPLTTAATKSDTLSVRGLDHLDRQVWVGRDGVSRLTP